MKKRIDTACLSAVDIYKLVLRGELKRFPPYFWEKPDSLNSAKEIVVYLFEEILNINDDDIKKSLSAKFFRDNQLGGMLSCLFQDSPFNALNNAYPDKYKVWEFNSVPANYWNIETAIISIKWLIEEKLKLSEEDLIKQLSVKLFESHNLIGMLQNVFNSSPYKAINSAYPNKYKPWEFNQVSRDYWNIQTATIAIKWLIEEKLKLTEEEIKKQIFSDIFTIYGLSGMLSCLFEDSPYNAIIVAYPNKYKPWELNQVPRGYWNNVSSIEAIKWLIEEKLKLTDDEIKEKLSVDLFRENNLQGMISNVFNNSPYDAINSAYPNKFKPWDFSRCPKNYWNMQTGIDAIKWTVEEKLNLSAKDIKNNTSRLFFKNNNLDGMIVTLFEGNPLKAMKTAYPEKFKS